MAKINATFGAGYHIPSNVNYLQFEEEQRQKQKAQRVAGVNPVMRQTFAAPFTIICTQCDGRTARGTKHYINRKKSGDKFLGQPIWEIEFRCPHCMKYFTIITDWETPKVTGGYTCKTNCKRPESDDFVSRNLANQAVVAERKEAKEDEARGGTGNMDALAKHNERMDQVHQLNAEIEARLAEKQLLQAGSSLADDSSDDPLHPSFGSNAAHKSGPSLSQRLVSQVREKRRREEAGEVVEDFTFGGNDDDDSSFDAFQAMLSRQGVESSADDDIPSSVSEADQVLAVGPSSAHQALDLKQLLSTASANRFHLDDEDMPLAAPSQRIVPAEANDDSGGVVLLKKRRGKSSSLFAQFDS